MQGGGLGLIGFALGIAVKKVESITLRESASYAFVAVISGAIAFYYAGVSPYQQYDYFIAIGIGWGFFFVLKAATFLMTKGANDPIPFISAIFNAWRGKK